MPTPSPSGYDGLLDQVVLVSRLREVRALSRFQTKKEIDDTITKLKDGKVDVSTDYPDFFPFATSPESAAFSYQQALQFYGADYVLREPRKTFRLTISTSF